MRKLYTVLVAAFVTATLFAQSPEKMSYQAVIRNASNHLITSTAVGMKTSILKGSASGTVVYAEIYNPNPVTNINGLVTVEIGGGIPFSGTYANINWSAGPFFLKTETDPTGGTNYTITGTSQLLSVPYALYARDVQNKNDADADPNNEIQALSINGTQLTLSKNGGTVSLPSSGVTDNWGTDFVRTDATLSGMGTVASPLKLADNAVTSVKVQDGSIVTADLADHTISTPKLGNLAVSSEKLQGGAVTSDKLSNNAVTIAKLPTGATNSTFLRGDGTWATPTFVTPPGGVSGNIQFNNGGVFGGDANLHWDNVNKRLGIGTTTPGALLDVDGNAKVNGTMTLTEVNRTTTGTTNLIPIAYGTVNSNGTIASGSGNFSVSYDSTNKYYEITIDGHNFSYAQYTVSVTHIGSGTIGFPSVTSNGGVMYVSFYMTDGNKKGSYFSFLVFKP